ncbi:MAG TPA: hypothetical protein VE988_28630 [Gemmataceae bacterium]|nr:hypothetical protein [Gemmataceae bacterium]
MKRLLPLAALICLPIGAMFTAASQGEKKASADLECPYYPLKKGTTWEYKSGGKVIEVKVADHETLDGLNCARVETTIPGGKLTEHLTVKQEGVFRMRSNGQDIKPPLLVLKFAANELVPKKDEHWFFECMVQNYSMKGKNTVGEDKLTIGKTTYDAITVKSSEMFMGNQPVTMQVWYAKDIGMVKQHLKLASADLDVTLELEKFTAGK